MKRLNVSFVGIFVFSIFMFFALGAIPSSAADRTPVPVEGGNLYFDKGSGAIVDCDEGVTKAVVPSTVEGVSVTSIGDRAFNKCSGLEKVVFQGDITSIKSHAFAGCASLSEINWPRTLNTIGDNAFWGCAMEEISLPESVDDIGWAAFYECRRLKKAVLPSGLKNIPGMCFSGCDLLTEVMIGEELQTVGETAFQHCKSLKTIVLPDSVKTLSDKAFSGCSGLEKVVLPERMERWGEMVFQGCETLTGMDIPKGIEAIGKNAFYECRNLTEVTVPEGVKSIDYNAFMFCYKLQKITLPQSVKTIDQDAFGGMDYRKFTVFGYRETPAEMITWKFVNLGPAWTVNRPTGYQDRNGTVVLKWDKRSDAKGYVIYRKERSGAYEKIGETVQASYNDLGISLGTVYDYKIRPYREKEKRYIEGDDSKTVTVVVKDFTGNQIPQWEYTSTETESSDYAPKQIQIRTRGAREVKLTWTSDVAQNHFYVYRSGSPNGKYTYVGQYLNGYKKAQLTDKKVKAGKTYYYRIKPAVESKWSKPVKAKVVPGQPKLKIKGLRGKKAKLTWKKVSGADGYYVYRAEKKNGKYKKIKTVKANKTSFTDKKLKKKHYYYKVKAYDKIAKKNYTSSYSNIGHVKRASKGYYKTAE
ncbi:leucine-rich repeat protein [Anaerovorax odorimutans]|uniref:Leucine-rich repeat protein n=1 Tax=Anaerovorax odorimutans TaxID=109327 RepID=A0ABT1RRW6_9FIRM|nr:leucine-rich repeat protein [Anaerovorax odorimutans]MCQ4637955.1 leucine-rich repeat protein [Anaerovorax odorimutans]